MVGASVQMSFLCAVRRARVLYLYVCVSVCRCVGVCMRVSCVCVESVCMLCMHVCILICVCKLCRLRVVVFMWVCMCAVCVCYVCLSVWV